VTEFEVSHAVVTRDSKPIEIFNTVESGCAETTPNKTAGSEVPRRAFGQSNWS
jgi:hypothetical protein